MKRITSITGITFMLCLFACLLFIGSGVNAANNRFVIEDAENISPSAYYDEKPTILESSEKIVSQGKKSFHFITGTTKDSGNITRYNWAKPIDLSIFAKSSVINLDLWVKNPEDIGDNDYGKCMVVCLGSRSNEKFITWYIGSRLLNANSWNNFKLHVKNGKAVIWGSTVNGKPISSDSSSLVDNGNMNWSKVNYSKIVLFVSKAPIEGYVDNWYVETFNESSFPHTTIKLSQIDDDSRRVRAEKLGSQPTEEYDIIPPDVRKDAFFKEDILKWDQAKNWTAVFYNCDSARFCLSMDQAIRGKKNAKIEFKTDSAEAKVIIIPPKPIIINKDFDTIEWWIHGNYHSGTEFTINFKQPNGEEYHFSGGTETYRDPSMLFDSWQLAHVVLPKKLQKGTQITSFEFSPPKAGKYLFHMDQMRVFDFKKMLSSTKAPVYKHVKDPIQLPIDKNGACPKTTENVSIKVEIINGVGCLSYTTDSGDKVLYQYKPETGTLTDLSVSVNGKPSFLPANGSGPIFEYDTKVVSSIKGECKVSCISANSLNDKLIYKWRYTSAAGVTDITYTFMLKGKTLAIESYSSDNKVAEWYFGKATGLVSPKVVELPFMNISPNVLVTDGMFVTYYMDWYKSNTSRIATFGANEVVGNTAAYSFKDPGHEYRKRTDGSRYSFKECFYITVSSEIEDCLLSISNPPSPNKNVLKERLWRLSAGAYQPPPGTDVVKLAKDTVDLYDKYGMNNIYFVFHAPFWSYRASRGPEPWHSRMQTSINIPGGDKAMIDLFSYMKTLGMRPGYYSGIYFTEPISKIWDYNSVMLKPDGSWYPVWVQSYHMNPWYFPEMVNTFYTKQVDKFKPETIYDDGWTSMQLWEANNYDHRISGSGKFIDTLKAVGTGWRDLRKVVDGPVFSEGNGGDYYSAGLNDGDYGKLKTYANGKNPEENRASLLVDFELRKVNPLHSPVSIDIGYLGYYNSFSSHSYDNYKYIYQFLVTQIAFGTIGMMEPYSFLYMDPKTSFDKTLTSYFMMQQIQKRYIMEEVEDIKYFDGVKLVSTSEAIRRDIYKNNKVYIKYKNGLEIYINCNWDKENWIVENKGVRYDLPPGGIYARQGDDFVEYSCMIDGRRVDFVDSPVYTYINANGKKITLAGITTDKIIVKNKAGRQAEKVIEYPETSAR